MTRSHKTSAPKDASGADGKGARGMQPSRGHQIVI
ncbi:MAG: hypothetical protein QOI67_1926 [Gaiellaceae bacterium]|jgi:hypothetical protein|nr:hypothetical protein [Gaiellaceae bacterium]